MAKKSCQDLSGEKKRLNKEIEKANILIKKVKIKRLRKYE